MNPYAGVWCSSLSHSAPAHARQWGLLPDPSLPQWLKTIEDLYKPPASPIYMVGSLWAGKGNEAA